MRALSLSLGLLLAALAAACSGTTPDLGSASCTPSCASGLTCVDNADFPGGVCTSRCGSGGTCPSGNKCVQLSTGEYCALSCDSGNGCPTGLVCGSGGSAGKVCLAPASAPATSISCSTAPVAVNGGLINAPETAGCVQPVVQSTYAPAPPAIGSTLPLGMHAVGTKLQFQLPAGTTGFTVVSQGSSSNVSKVSAFGALLPNGPLPTPIQEPNGTFFDYPASFDLAPPDRALTWSPISPVTGSVTFPNGTAGLEKAAKGLTPGTWTLTVSDLLHECKTLQCGDPASGSTADSYDVTVLTRSGGIPERGALDLAIYLVSGSLSAATAPDDPDIRRMLQRVTADFARAGICLQTVTYYDVPDWARTRWAVVTAGPAAAAEPCSEYRQIFTLARPGNSVALFFVDQITEPNAPSGTRLIGYDGAIPGVSTFNGTIAGGALVSSGDLHSTAGCTSAFSTSCGPDVVGETVAHEVSHALGLFHTTESQGASGEDFDPMTDTPQCLCSLCVTDSARPHCADQPNVQGQPATVDGANCGQGTQACGGADYLMFWELTNLSRGNLSPQEGQVMRLNPLVRPL
ncbi:MAG: hypothetical protein ACXWK5_07160 [Myxococcaceae bacterium]